MRETSKMKLQTEETSPKLFICLLLREIILSNQVTQMMRYIFLSALGQRLSYYVSKKFPPSIKSTFTIDIFLAKSCDLQHTFYNCHYCVYAMHFYIILLNCQVNGELQRN